MTPIFFYGTLRHLPLLEVVLGGAPVAAVDARLADHTVRRIDGQNFPVIQRQSGQVAIGILLNDLTAQQVARIDYYVSGFGHALQNGVVDTGQGTVSAKIYYPHTELNAVDESWSLADWADRFGDIVVATAHEFIDGFGTIPSADAAQRYPQMMVRASANLRASMQDVPRDIRQGPGRSRIKPIARRRPYSNFFAIEEHELSFPSFDKTMSAPVTRAVLVSGDAVTVLPYDPQRDRVMVIEQFRIGSHVRGDKSPWTLEPIAGRIDPGETPEQTAHREMAEEAGLTARKLLSVANYFSSPGGSTEYLYSYIAIADLPDDAAGIGGLTDEGEDIRSYILPFARAMGLISSGEAETGPLILSLLWLQARRDAIRDDA